jgi:hypothetical protein
VVLSNEDNPVYGLWNSCSPKGDQGLALKEELLGLMILRNLDPCNNKKTGETTICIVSPDNRIRISKISK